MDGTLALALTGEMERDDQESAERIKDIVSQSLREADHGVKVVPTGHFNNSIAADLVLEWPGEPSKRPKHVYLRPSEEADYLAEEVALLGGPDTLLITLTELNEGSPYRDELETSARAGDTLVAPMATFETLGDQRRTLGAGAGLVAESTVRGGRGYLPRGDAAVSTAAAEAAFVGAQEVNGQAVLEGAEAYSGHLQSSEAARVAEVIQAVWTASGGSSAAFPIPQQSLSPLVGSDALAYLLDTFGEVDDDGFWRRLARGLDLEQLLGLESTSNPAALARLMRFLAPRVVAKACAMRDTDIATAFQWRLHERQLSVVGRGRVFAIGARLADLPDRTSVADGVHLDVLGARADKAGFTVTECFVANSVRTLTYRLEAPLGSDEHQLADLRETLTEDDRVRSARVTEKSWTSTFIVDFERQTTSGSGSSRPGLDRTLSVAAHMLDDLPTSQREELDALVARPDDDVEGDAGDDQSGEDHNDASPVD